jgi:hypothetical protein
VSFSSVQLGRLSFFKRLKAALDFCDLDCFDVALNQPGQFTGFGGRQFTMRYCQSNCGHSLRCIGGRVQFRDCEMHWPITSRWYDTIEAQAQRDHVAALGFLDGLTDQCFGFAVEKLLGQHGGSIASARWPPSGVARLTLSERLSSLFPRCIFSSHLGGSRSLSLSFCAAISMPI